MIRMRVRKLVSEIHRNAVEHGWCDEDRDRAEIIALIHSEWSEALEEARAGRPMLWYGENMKPEGVAVELVDGAIRIFDYIGRMAKTEPVGRIVTETLTDDDVYAEIPDDTVGLPIAGIIARLHYNTSMAYAMNDVEAAMNMLLSTAFMAMKWIRINGCDPDETLRIKHEYNMTRPYKHGKKF